MSDSTKIEWTDTTWNPIVGCTRVSPGCAHCYAMTIHDRRHKAWREGKWPKAPVQYHQPFEGKVQLLPERLDQPLRWKKPRRVFVNSLSDLFHEDVPFEFIERVWDTMFDCSGVVGGRVHTFQILTKRPERMLEFSRWMNDTRLRRIDYPNVWLGVSAENQRMADARIPLLLQTPAAVRFVSLEPLLGPIDLGEYRYGHEEPGTPFSDPPSRTVGGCSQWTPPLRWVIVGGESGAKARPMDMAWARSIVEECKTAGVPAFYKQGGAAHRCEHSAKGGCLACIPEDLRVREFPEGPSVSYAMSKT